MNLRACSLAALLAASSFVRAAEPPHTPGTNAIAPISTNAIAPISTNAPAVTETNTSPVNGTNPVAVTVKKLPRDTSTVEAFHGMQLRKGFRLQLAASHPQIKVPVAMAFDANGRLYVVEQGADADPGTVKLLEDLDGDGSFEKFTTFASGLTKPTAIACYSGGVFVASGSKIVFLMDTNNDGVADLQREIYGGFQTTTANSDPGGGINNFTWGLDNRIHAATAGVGGSIECLAITSADTLQLSGYDFAFDPKSLAIGIESDGINRGLSFDNAGRRFTCAATRPASMTVCDPIRSTRNAAFIWPQISAELPVGANAAFRLASGLHVYRGGALPATMVNDVFIADPVLGTITRFHLREDGYAPSLERPPVEATSPFMFSGDASFRPIQVISAPDGTLYVADLAREKFDQYADTGRIWRISPTGLKQAMPPKLAAFKTPDLVTSLASPNGWVRDTAARLLFERHDTNCIPLLSKQLAKSHEPLARLHSLYTLAGLEALKPDDISNALADEDDRVREQAVRLANAFIQNGNIPNGLWSQLAVHANNRSPRVRFELAFTAGAVKRPNAALLLANIARNSGNDRAVLFAIQSASAGRAADVFLELVGDRRLAATPVGWQFLGDLAELAGFEKRTSMDALLTAIERAQPNPENSMLLARRLGDGLTTGGSTFAGTSPKGTWKAFGSVAMNHALNANNIELRAESIHFLGIAGYSDLEITDWLLAFVVANEPPAVQSAAIEALSHSENPAITSAFVQRWPSLPAPSRRDIIIRMLARYDRTMALMTAIEERRIPADALNTTQISFLRSHPDVNIAARAIRLYGRSDTAGLAAQYEPALQLKGSAFRGRELFNARCANCHQFRGEGGTFAPELDGRTSRERERLLQDIVEPDRNIAPEYQVSVVQKRNSELVVGLLSKSGPDVLVVRQPGSQIFIPRTQAQDTLPQNWSLMPASAAAGLSLSDMADLLAFLTSGR
ncbi:MAG: hypothetical protein RLY20_464 [Verrucomicrobiota bacterium]|jgi:putative heme-binding domain-containing protein